MADLWLRRTWGHIFVLWIKQANSELLDPLDFTAISCTWVTEIAGCLCLLCKVSAGWYRRSRSGNLDTISVGVQKHHTQQKKLPCCYGIVDDKISIFSEQFRNFTSRLALKFIFCIGKRSCQNHLSTGSLKYLFLSIWSAGPLKSKSSEDL